METYAHFTEIPHIMPMSGVSTHAYGAFDPSLPADHPFVTRATHFDFHLSPYEQAKAREAALTPQPWWKGDDLSSYPMGYLPPEYPSYADRFSPWNSGISTISDPQSPRSSNSGSIPGMNCVASPSYRHEEMPITTVDDQSGYPAPAGLVDMDHPVALSRPRVFKAQPDHRSSFECDFEPWSGSQSDRNVTPEQQWTSSSLPTDAMGLSQPMRRGKGRPVLTPSRVRKSTERRPTSAPGRNRRRRGVTSAPSADGGVARTFVCSFAPYGCESTFVSKNEWKRHVTSQHLQLGFYRCDVGKCSAHSHQNSPSHFLSPPTPPGSTSSTAFPGQPNDFNRKDLFTQHQRRMHAPWLQSGRRRTPSDAEHAAFEASLDEVRRRCWHGLRQPPFQSHCGFCQEVFAGEGSWDTRMEHVGRHFEREDRQNLGEEVEDLALREWGLREGILTLVDGKCRLTALIGVDL
ncbi:uncharacterized protein N7459_002391 [Penicillium hispanicum]|uniref:uncharacterized protein n=1 Tax=Penicillium hispanicum TaxID=1080232 RepID=UPI0025423961|nr:uncharacterized protein N7459_002391 [Penicillium hispanicum]KAJ5592022.1 hypothetical protein N7459_002391 [Penicillium hispanicum]